MGKVFSCLIVHGMGLRLARGHGIGKDTLEGWLLLVGPQDRQAENHEFKES